MVWPSKQLYTLFILCCSHVPINLDLCAHLGSADHAVALLLHKTEESVSSCTSVSCSTSELIFKVMLQCITTNFKFFEATNFVNLNQQLIKPGRR